MSSGQGVKNVISTLNSMMARHNKNAGVTDEQKLQKLQQLGSITKHRRAAKKVVKNKDTIRGLLDSIKTRPRFGRMVKFSVECLKNLAFDEVSVEELIDEGTLDVLQNVMKLNPYNEDLQRIINQCLSQMCVNERMAALIAEKFGTQNLLFSLKKHTEPETQKLTCEAILNIMKGGSEVVDRFVNDGVIEALRDMIRANPDATDVVAMAAKCLAKIAEDPKHAKRLMESGVIDDILAALKKNPDNAELAEAGISLINQLAHADEETLQKLKDMGAMKIVSDCLNAQPDNELLNSLGRQLLDVISGKEDVDDALQHVASGSTDQDKADALATVGSLALAAKNVESIVESGGIASICNLVLETENLGQHDENTMLIIERGCRGLARLANTENNIYTIMGAGGVKLCVKALVEYDDNEKVLSAALQALTKMSTRQENCKYIVDVGAVKAAIAAINKHPESDRVAMHAVSLLAAIAVHEDLIDECVNQGAINAILDIIRNHGDVPEILEAAINCLGRMAISPENLARVRDLQGFELLIDTLNKNFDKPAVAKQAMLMLETCALIPENVELLKDMGAVDAFLKAVEANPDDADIQEIGARALGIFASDKQIEAVVGNIETLINKLKNMTQMGSSTHLINGVIAQLAPALALLGSLAAVEDNHGKLEEFNVMKLMQQAVEIGSAHAMGGEDDADALTAIVKALEKLASSSKNAEFLVTSGVFSKVLASALEHKENENLAEHTLALGEVLAAEEKLVDALVDCGIIDGAIQLAEEHPLSSKVLSSAARILGYCATNDKNISDIMAKNGAAVVVESVLTNIDDPNELKVALAVMSNIASNEETARALVDAGAIEALVEVMKVHEADPEICVAAMQCFGRLAVTEDIAELIGQKGALPLICDTLRTHHNDEEVIETACVLLSTLGSVVANGKLLVTEYGADELMEWAKEAYSDNAVIVESTESTLASLESAFAEEAPIVLHTEEIIGLDVNELLAHLDPSHDRADLLKTCQQVVDLMSAEDLARAKDFIQDGGLVKLSEVLLNHLNEEDIFNAVAVDFQAIQAHAHDLWDPESMEGLHDPRLVEALVRILEPHGAFSQAVGDDKKLMACKLLGDLVSEDANIEALLKNGGLGHLLKLLTSDDEAIREAAMRVLAKCSNDEAVAKWLAQLAGNIEELIRIMRLYMKFPEFEKFAVYLLGNLAINEQIKDQIGQLGGIQVIIDLMKLHPSHQQLIENCCYTLGNLSINHEANMVRIVKYEGIHHLIEAITNHPSAEDLLISGICALSNLCYRSDTNKELIVKSGGGRTVVSAVLSNFNNSELVVSAYRCIGNLAFYPPNVGAVIKDGAVQAIVAGLTVHADDKEVIQIGIGVLTNLASDRDPQSMAIMAQEGAVQAVLDVAENHVNESEIEVIAIGCLCNLAREDYNSSLIVKHRACQMLKDVIEAIGFDSEVIVKVAQLMFAMSRAKANADRLVRDGAGGIIKDILGGDNPSLGVVTDCLRAVTNIAHTEENSRAFAGQGVVDAVMTASKDHIDNENSRAFAGQGVVDAVMTASKDHIDNGKLILEIIKCLDSLARSEYSADAMAAQALGMLEMGLQMHNQDAKVVAFGLSFIGNLCVHPTAAEAVEQTNIPTVIVSMMRYHMDNPHCVHQGCAAIENIARAADKLKEFMKRKGIVKSLEELRDSTTSRELKDAIQNAINAITKQVLKNKARMLFEEEEETKEETVIDLDDDTRNMLTSGILFTKHSNTAKPRPRQVWVSSDLKRFQWSAPGKGMKEGNDMKWSRIRTIEKGRFTPQLKRTDWRGRPLAREECSFAVIGRERTVDLEAKNEAERDKWVKALLQWKAYMRFMREEQAKFKT